MRTVYTLFFIVAIILHSIELSSQSNVGPSRSRRPPPGSESRNPNVQVVRLQMFEFPENLLTRARNGGYQRMLMGKIPALIVNDFAIARVQNTAMLRGIFNAHHVRVKVNIVNNEVQRMSDEEIEAFPIDEELRPGQLVLLNNRP